MVFEGKPGLSPAAQVTQTAKRDGCWAWGMSNLGVLVPQARPATGKARIFAAYAGKPGRIRVRSLKRRAVAVTAVE
jgi:hypothetical protein